MTKSKVLKTTIIAAILIMGFVTIVSAADGQVTTSEGLLVFLTGLSPFIGAGAYGAYMYYQNNRKEGEAFSWEKFGPTLLMGLVISIALYFTGGTEITTGTIAILLAQYMPILADTGLFTLVLSTGLFGAVIGYFDQFIKTYGGSHAEESVAAPTQAPAVSVPTTTNPVNLPDGGCDVTPSIEGKVFHLIYGLKSPAIISFALTATQPTTDHSGYVSVDIDWDDGTVQNVPLVNGLGTVEHRFIFSKNTKYTGYTFNPVFTFNENTGEKFVVNGEKEGVGTRTIEIGVEAS